MVRRVELHVGFEYRGVEIQRQARGPFESGETLDILAICDTYTFSLYFAFGVLVSSRVADAKSV